MPLLKRLHVETDEVYVCSFTADGMRTLTGAQGSPFQLWDAAEFPLWHSEMESGAVFSQWSEAVSSTASLQHVSAPDTPCHILIVDSNPGGSETGARSVSRSRTVA
jgi:hypothetical protein